MSLSIEDILAEARLPEDCVTLFVRGDLAAEYERLDRQLAGASRQPASLGEPSPASAIVEAMTALHEQMSAVGEADFRLRALDAKSWSDLFAKRPEAPTAEDGQEVSKAAKDQFTADWHAWVCAMVAATCYEPKMTAKQAEKLAAKLADSQWKELSNSAYSINVERQSIPFSAAASAILRHSEPK